MPLSWMGCPFTCSLTSHHKRCSGLQLKVTTSQHKTLYILYSEISWIKPLHFQHLIIWQ
uniref:Uncharacterized protein n=1 Tax=Arundo donax TaxID=35708 RepID=A0A0A9GB19_ARUDO